jgi:hypothetical protein
VLSLALYRNVDPVDVLFGHRILLWGYQGISHVAYPQLLRSISNAKGPRIEGLCTIPLGITGQGCSAPYPYLS